MLRSIAKYTVIVLAVFFTLFPVKAYGTVNVEVYYSKYCEECHKVMNEILPELKKKYGEKVRFEYYEVEENAENYEKLLKREEEVNDRGNEFPVIFVGNKVFGGLDEVVKGLASAIEDAIKLKKPAPTKPQKIAEKETTIQKTPTKQETAPIKAADEKPSAQPERIGTVYVAFFSKRGCAHCDRVHLDLEFLRKKYPTNDFPVAFVYKTFEIEKNESKLLNEALCERLNVPEKHRLATPAVFFEKHSLITGLDKLNEPIMDSIVHLYPRGSSKFWMAVTDSELLAAKNRIAHRFSKFHVAPIIFAGLLDGINPCAMGALIFFITFLTVAGRKKREIIMVGISYTLAVFVTYYLIGIGLLSFVSSLSIFKVIARWVYLATAILAAGLGVFSIVDYIRAKKGDIGDMVLKLPNGLRKRIHRFMISANEPRKRRNFILAALVTGFLVSLLELACTGQVYLPTIIFVMGIPGLRLKAYLYLLLYNLMFILPLLAVFIVSYFGATSEQLNAMLQQKTAIIKLFTALLFFTMAGLLFRVIIVG